MAKDETTSEDVATAASFILRDGGDIIADAMACVTDDALVARLGKYHRCAMAAAGSALTQTKDVDQST